MELIAEPLPGAKIFKPSVFEDNRGSFIKSFHLSQLSEFGVNFHLKEEFFSTSTVSVIRGMHFQIPPHAHQKIVYCVSGRVMDVLLDIRKNSPTYGQSIGFEISQVNRHIIYIPIGFAHGFYSLEADSCLIYKTDSLYSAHCDQGIRWDSFSFEWPNKNLDPIVSLRDQTHTEFANFISPF